MPDPCPTDAAIAEAQRAYEMGEMSLLAAVFYAEALGDMGSQDRDKAAPALDDHGTSAGGQNREPGADR
jgi:hypothetical protein